MEEILQETKRAAIRAEVAGASGWAKPYHKSFNKRFLNNTVLSTVSGNCRRTGLKPLLKEESKAFSTGTVSNSKAEEKRNNVQAVKKSSLKIQVSSKARLKAYREAAQLRREQERAREMRGVPGLTRPSTSVRPHIRQL